MCVYCILINFCLPPGSVLTGVGYGIRRISEICFSAGMFINLSLFFLFSVNLFLFFFLHFSPRNVSDADHLIAGQHGLPAQPLRAVHGLLCTESAPGELSQVFIFVIFIFSPVFICTNTTINFFRQHFFRHGMDNDYFRPGENISSSSH